jgi:very-short-patch-repair endonuclease
VKKKAGVHISVVVEDVMRDLFQKRVKTQLGVDLETEYRFHEKRKWRFDYALVEQRIAIEVEGGVWTGGRHTRGAGFLKDVEKYNEAAVRGWMVIRVTPDQLNGFTAVEWLERALNQRRAG